MGPDIRHARNGDVATACHVGNAERDLVFLPHHGSNLVDTWDSRYRREMA